MRVIILASGDLWAGAEVVVYQLAQGLAEIVEVQLLVIVLNHGRLAEKIEKIRVRVLIVDESEHSFFSCCMISKR